MTTINDFYDAMRILKEVRSELITTYLETGVFPQKIVSSIDSIHQELKDIPKNDALYVLKTKTNEALSIELDYELNELEKDRCLFQHGIDGIDSFLRKNNARFDKELQEGLSFLNDKRFDHFFTDRDGTVSNYCGRYLSSIQGVFNALMLNQFSKTITGRSIIITAAPLIKGGLTEVSTLPKGNYILAGSKGRELLDENGTYHSLPIEAEKQSKLDALYNELEHLLENKEYSIFKYTGSGLQRKFGEIALARQNKDYSIPHEKSLDFKTKVIECMHNADPDGHTLVLDDTGKDLEINLSYDKSNGKDFNKGHGLAFISKTLDLDLKDKHILICGDTFSDVPMLNSAQNLGAHVSTVFVTENADLKQKVSGTVANACFVSSPDVLIYMLFKYSKDQNSWNSLS